MVNSLNNTRSVVIIPAYEPPHSFIDYAQELSDSGFAEIVVVNDGSGEKYTEIYQAIAQIPRCTVLSYENNQGKGYALKHAFAYCKENFDDNYVFVTADCDGQHLTKDVGNVAKYACENPEMLILGSRNFDTAGVPKRSYTGNTFTRKLYRFLYGRYIGDTQTGLRAFSYRLLDEMLTIQGNRFEYEMNMLILLPQHGYEIKEIGIDTVYHEKPDDVEKNSHYHTVKDSVRIAGVVLKNPGGYFLSTALFTLLEIFAFLCLTQYALTLRLPLPLTALIPAVGARLLSTLLNLIFNGKLLFGKAEQGAGGRYFLLWLILLAASYGVTCGLLALYANTAIALTKIAVFTTLLKMAWDFAVGIFSREVQSAWVFRDGKKKNLAFYGSYFHFGKFFVNLFSPKYKVKVSPPDEEKPVVYVGRHLNEHGPIKCVQALPFDVHIFALHTFFSFQSTYEQFANYTFTEKKGVKGIGVFFAKIGAFFAALAIAPFVRSAKAIPVYRGGTDSLKTLRKAMEYLDANENVIVFPDIDYTAAADESSDIYTGFLFLDKLYYKKHGEHLQFVVLSVDDEKKLITEKGRISFPENGNFKRDLPEVAAQLHELLMSK